MKPLGTGMTTENCEAPLTVMPSSLAGTLVGTGAMEAVTVEPWTAVGGRLTAVSTSWMTPVMLLTLAPMYSPTEAA